MDEPIFDESGKLLSVYPCPRCESMMNVVGGHYSGGAASEAVECPTCGFSGFRCEDNDGVEYRESNPASDR